MPSQAEVRGVMRRIVLVHFERHIELWAASWVFLGLACCEERGDSYLRKSSAFTDPLLNSLLSKSKRDAIGCDMRSVLGSQSGGMVVVEFHNGSVNAELLRR